ncbi:hypothetical protein JQ032_00160 [Clostridium botulinum]|nr:hypothetical protein [Clostridium botulinum]
MITIVTSMGIEESIKCIKKFLNI